MAGSAIKILKSKFAKDFLLLKKLVKQEHEAENEQFKKRFSMSKFEQNFADDLVGSSAFKSLDRSLQKHPEPSGSSGGSAAELLV